MCCYICMNCDYLTRKFLQILPFYKIGVTPFFFSSVTDVGSYFYLLPKLWNFSLLLQTFLVSPVTLLLIYSCLIIRTICGILRVNFNQLFTSNSSQSYKKEVEGSWCVLICDEYPRCHLSSNRSKHHYVLLISFLSLKLFNFCVCLLLLIFNHIYSQHLISSSYILYGQDHPTLLKVIVTPFVWHLQFTNIYLSFYVF